MTVITLQGSKLKTIKSQSDLEKNVVMVKPIYPENSMAVDKVAVIILSDKQEIKNSDYVFYECGSEEIAYRGARFATFMTQKESYVIQVKKGFIVVCDAIVKEYTNYTGNRYYDEISYPCIVAKVFEPNS
jgi:hypothetical protein